MKRTLLTLAILSTVVLVAQAQHEIGNEFFDHVKNDVLILTDNELLKGERKTKNFVSKFSASHGQVSSYQKDFGIAVNAMLDYEIGEFQTGTSSFKVMFLKRKDDPSKAEIEFLVIYEHENPTDELAGIDAQRKEWMRLCNAHKANELVKNVYTADAYYYNRGRLISGTKAISQEYSYMNSASYSLKLTPKHVEFVTPNIAYEIGRCSGSYPLPYMLLWQKQADGSWQVLMDSNF